MTVLHENSKKKAVAYFRNIFVSSWYLATCECFVSFLQNVNFALNNLFFESQTRMSAT